MQEDKYEKEMQDASLRMQYAGLTNQHMASEIAVEERERGMIYEQLNLDEEIERIENLLRGKVLVMEGERKVWKESEDPDMHVFTEYGIHLILNTIAWYINKNTLLSNYEDKAILFKINKIGHVLNGTIFMQYERVFKMPTLDEAKTVYNNKINEEVERRVLYREIKGFKADKTALEKEVRDEIVDPINAIRNIQGTIIKSRLSRMKLLIREIMDAIHSTYNRAYKGQERRTLREHIHVSENRNQLPQQQKGGLFKWFTGAN